MYSIIRNNIIRHKVCELTVQSLSAFKSLNTTTNGLKCFENENKILLKNLNSIKTSKQLKRELKTSVCYKSDENITSFDAMDGFIYKVRRRLGYTSIPKSILRNTSVYLYESCTDLIPIENFFSHLKLPDTYLSWYLVIQLHVWMCMLRAASEGKEGRVLRNEIVSRMWEDCETRLKKTMYLKPSIVRKGFEDLSQQFSAAMIAYDEGFLTNDKTLAAALWRTLFTYETVDPQSIEVMVSYIRTQVEHLNTIQTEKFFLNGKISWKPFPPLIS